MTEAEARAIAKRNFNTWAAHRRTFVDELTHNVALQEAVGPELTQVELAIRKIEGQRRMVWDQINAAEDLGESTDGLDKQDEALAIASRSYYTQMDAIYRQNEAHLKRVFQEFGLTYTSGQMFVISKEVRRLMNKNPVKRLLSKFS